MSKFSIHSGNVSCALVIIQQGEINIHRSKKADSPLRYRHHVYTLVTNDESVKIVNYDQMTPVYVHEFVTMQMRPKISLSV